MSALPALELPSTSLLEQVVCYLCGVDSRVRFITAEDDLTGKPGRFRFVRCNNCGLVYQNPRFDIEKIKEYYDDQYIAHRKQSNWGAATRFFNATMDRLDRKKGQIASRFVPLNERSKVLDVGCGAATFLLQLQKLYGCSVTGVDFKDLSSLPGFESIDFRCGLLYEQQLASASFDLVTMWHFLEHDYDPLRSLRETARVLTSDGVLIIEVPRLDSLTFNLYQDRWPGLQAPQHTVLYSRETLLRMVEKAELEVIDYLAYGAFPAYYYLFTGAAFKLLKGRGLNLSRAIYPYFLGQLLLGPVLSLCEKKLNLAMQTVICRKLPSGQAFSRAR